MNILSIYNQVLAKESQINSIPVAESQGDTLKDEGISFKEIINREMENLNNQQIKSDQLTQGFISGEVEDLHTVLIAIEEARLSLELAVQVRNKCVEAYKEINNMQL